MKKTFSILLVAALICAMGNISYSQNVNVTPNAATYATLGAAFTAINAGIHGAGTVLVSIKGNTTELAAATLNGGVVTSCRITPVGARTVTGNLASGVIVFSGADNCSIDGLNSGGNSLTVVNPNAAATANGVECINGATNDTIRNLTAIGLGASGATAGGRGINIGQSTAGTGGNNDNVISGCTTNGFRRGIQIFGTAGLFINQRTTVRNCIVKNWTSLGIFLGSESGNNLCENNEVLYDAAVPNDPAGCRAINVQSCGNEIVRNNRVHDLTGTIAGGYIGIIAIPAIFTAPIPTPPTKVEIYNNMIALNNVISSAPFVYGIFPTSNPNTTNYTVNVYYNSIRIGGNSGATAAALSIGLVVLQDGLHGPDTSRVCNNVSVNDRIGGDIASLHVGQNLDQELGVSLEADYNATYASDTTGRGWDAWYGPTLYRGEGGNALYWDSTCADGIEQLTAFQNTSFVSSTDLHLTPNIGGNMDANPIPGITTDIDGNSRAIDAVNVFTYRGADEHRPDGDPTWKKTSLAIRMAFQGATEPDIIVFVLIKLYCLDGSIRFICREGRVDPDGTITFIGGLGPLVKNGFCWPGEGPANAVRTWSNSALDFSPVNVSYDFTTSVSQAFGSNQFGTSAPFAIYGGDVNQDDIVDLTDAGLVDNASFNFVSGCRIPADVNFDQVVDLSDASIVDNNAFNFIAAVIPPGIPTAPFIQNTDNANTKNSTMQKPRNILTHYNYGLSN